MTSYYDMTQQKSQKKKHDKTLILHGLMVGDTIVTAEPQKTIRLGEEWQHTFNEKPFDADAARAFLAEQGDFGCYENPLPPDIWTYFRVTNNKKATAPRTATFPYGSWHNRHAAGTLFECDLQTGT